MTNATKDSETAWKEAKLQRFNLAILGGTGVGKSSLVNAVFGADFARTGIGRPVTKGVQFFTNKNGTLGLYDFEGAESFAALESFVSNFQKIYEERVAENIKDAPHGVWYCIKASDRRLDDQQKNLIRRLSTTMNLPVFLVLTQTPWKPSVGYPSDVKEFVRHIKSEGLPIETGEPITVAALDDEFNGTKKHGLKRLVELTEEAAPRGVREALAAAQRIDRHRKRRAAVGVVTGAVALATVVGVSPTPVPDAVILAPIQSGMMAKVALIFNVDLTGSLVTSVIADLVGTTLGKAIVSNFAKFLGPWGLALNAAVAGTITAAIGHAWLTLCERDYLGQIDLSAVISSGDFVRVFDGLVTDFIKRNPPAQP